MQKKFTAFCSAICLVAIVSLSGLFGACSNPNGSSSPISGGSSGSSSGAPIEGVIGSRVTEEQWELAFSGKNVVSSFTFSQETNLSGKLQWSYSNGSGSSGGLIGAGQPQLTYKFTKTALLVITNAKNAKDYEYYFGANVPEDVIEKLMTKVEESWGSKLYSYQPFDDDLEIKDYYESVISSMSVSDKYSLYTYDETSGAYVAASINHAGKEDYGTVDATYTNVVIKFDDKGRLIECSADVAIDITFAAGVEYTGDTHITGSSTMEISDYDATVITDEEIAMSNELQKYAEELFSAK